MLVGRNGRRAHEITLGEVDPDLAQRNVDLPGKRYHPSLIAAQPLAAKLTDLAVAQRHRMHPAPDAVPGLEDRDTMARLGEAQRSGQAGHPCADDDDSVHNRPAWRLAMK